MKRKEIFSIELMVKDRRLFYKIRLMGLRFYYSASSSDIDLIENIYTTDNRYSNELALMQEVREYQKIVGSHAIFLGGRGIKLSEEQKQYIDQLESKTASGEYTLKNISCLCGSENDEIIAIKDRYGINIRTVICKNCGLIRTNPYYDEKSLESFYKTEYDPIYRGGVKNFSHHFEWLKKRGEEIIDTLRNNNIGIKGKTVYEIGCAGGGALQAFKDTGCTVKGCDYNERLINQGRDQGLDLSCGGMECFEKDGQADIVIMRHVLEHIPEPIGFLKELRNILKDDGLLWIEVPTLEDYNNDSYINNTIRHNMFFKFQNAHVWYFSTNTLCYVMECAGFKCLPVRYNRVIGFKGSEYRKTDDIDKNEYGYAVDLLEKTDRQLFEYNLRMEAARQNDKKLRKG